MSNLDSSGLLFVAWAFLFQVILIVHFSVRKWAFDLVLKYGWIVYLMGIPAVVISILLLISNQTWSFWMGGWIFLVWAVYGYIVEYLRKIQWRSPIRWSIFGPYVILYLATIMFYWWPLALIWKPLWYIYAVLFIASTVLNVTSHQPSGEGLRPGKGQI